MAQTIKCSPCCTLQEQWKCDSDLYKGFFGLQTLVLQALVAICSITIKESLFAYLDTFMYLTVAEWELKIRIKHIFAKVPELFHLQLFNFIETL